RRRNRRRSAARAARARVTVDLTSSAAGSPDVAASLPDSALDDFSALVPAAEPDALEPDRLDPDRPRPAFAHASEEEMARILDFYRIRWEYEPHTFPILWNLDGAVVESFSPDFWLPDLELYLEMTT